MNENIPDNHTIWDAVMQSRMDIAELKGMLTMHFRDGEHHHPPCAPAAHLQRTLLAAAGASALALLAAVVTLFVALKGGG